MAEADRALAQHPGEVFDLLNRDFERIPDPPRPQRHRRRRIEAAQLLGHRRNTITRIWGCARPPGGGRAGLSSWFSHTRPSGWPPSSIISPSFD